MRILGVDYGEKRIGLAISDESGLIASPMPTLKVKSFADAISKIHRITKTQGASVIVMGLPLGPKREETKQSIQIRYFARALQTTDSAEIEFWNESFTTKQARDSSKKNATSKKKRSIDSEVARFILQEYLDYQYDIKKGGPFLPRYEPYLVE